MTVAPETISIPALATALNMARPTISSRLQAAGVPPAGTGRTGHPVYAVGPALRAVLAPAAAVDVDNLSPAQRLHYYRGLELERELADMTSQLIERDVSEQNLARMRGILAEAETEILAGLAKILPAAALVAVERHVSGPDR